MGSRCGMDILEKSGEKWVWFNVEMEYLGFGSLN
jgi:hypothetical protein